MFFSRVDRCLKVLASVEGRRPIESSDASVNSINSVNVGQSFFASATYSLHHLISEAKPPHSSSALRTTSFSTTTSTSSSFSALLCLRPIFNCMCETTAPPQLPPRQKMKSTSCSPRPPSSIENHRVVEDDTIVQYRPCLPEEVSSNERCRSRSRRCENDVNEEYN